MASPARASSFGWISSGPEDLLVLILTAFTLSLIERCVILRSVTDGTDGIALSPGGGFGNWVVALYFSKCIVTGSSESGFFRL